MKNQNTKVIHSPKNHQCPSRRGDHQLWSTGILSPKKLTNEAKKKTLEMAESGKTANKYSSLAENPRVYKDFLRIIMKKYNLDKI